MSVMRDRKLLVIGISGKKKRHSSLHFHFQRWNWAGLEKHQLWQKPPATSSWINWKVPSLSLWGRFLWCTNKQQFIFLCYCLYQSQKKRKKEKIYGLNWSTVPLNIWQDAATWQLRQTQAGRHTDIYTEASQRSSVTGGGCGSLLMSTSCTYLLCRCRSNRAGLKQAIKHLKDSAAALKLR